MDNFYSLSEKLPIYEHFIKVASVDQQQMVASNVKKCAPLLDQVYKAFHTYTLHNIQHQANILRIMGEILAEDLQHLSALEAALLILVTFYHDIGMVFKDEELRRIKEEDSFKEFIENNYGAKLAFEKNNGELTAELAGWYCRWMHARRVWNFLQDDELQWDGISLKKTVGDICESHNEPANSLGDDSKFETDFQKQADTRFCALLLRLGDILDFDSSRSSQSVFEFLELDKPKNTLEQVSSNEWEKHLASNGFTIARHHGTVQLSFSAGPKHPEVKRGIQQFLDVIEKEIEACNHMLPKCSTRWRDLKLSPSIDRKNIRSQNYKKGSYRLSLDEKQIITLLSGENLYSSPFEFIRELLQNAIDASRMREFHEQYLGNSQFKSSAIHVTSWVDDQGFRWVRVDDQGMGLNEYVIENHLLRKGNSFYRSDYFKLLQHQYQQKTGRNFTPISRFGIGLLSCFILGDKIEIASKAVALPAVNQQQQSIRLSITGLDGDYILQTASEKHQPLPFPSQKGPQAGFRNDYGSSIAVRIRGSRDYLGFEDEIKNTVYRYVTCSPVDIYYNGEKLGNDFSGTLNTPFCSYKRIPLPNEERERIASELELAIDGELCIEIIPVDITKSSPNPNLMGQLCLIRLLYDDKAFDQHGLEWSFHMTINGPKYIEFRRRTRNPQTHREESKTSRLTIEEIFDGTFSEENLKKIFNPGWAKEGDLELVDYIKLVHNGIDVPNHGRHSIVAGIYLQDFFTKDKYHFSHQNFHAVFGIVYLQDDLIPDLSVSRNAIRRIGFSIYSGLYFATRHLNNYTTRDHWFNYLGHAERFFLCQEVMNDYNVVNGHWDDIPLIYTKDGIRSVNQLKKQGNDLPVVIDYNTYKPFVSALVSGLLNIHFYLKYIFNDSQKCYELNITGIRPVPAYTCHYFNSRPLAFLDFDNDTVIAHGNFFNKNHWFVRWLLSNEQGLVNHFESYLYQLTSAVLNGKIEVANSVLDHLRKSSLLSTPTENLSEKDFAALADSKVC